MPPDLKLRGFTEKYVVKEMARALVPPEIVEREKFGWYAPSSAALLQAGSAWAWDLLSYERVRRHGYFDPDTVERLKRQYASEGFTLAQPFETDWLTLVLTFGLLVDRFELPCLS
jgi:asparagine synthase (glutamine-hydrolysing)